MNEHNRLTAEENRAFYRMAIALVIPMALQNLINVGVTTADVVMLGKVGETALSGASLAGQVQFIMNLIFFGLTSGASVLTAQYWGKQDVRTIEKVFGISMCISLGIGLVFLAAASILYMNHLISEVVSGLCTIIGLILLFAALWLLFGRKQGGSGRGPGL